MTPDVKPTIGLDYVSFEGQTTIVDPRVRFHLARPRLGSHAEFRGEGDASKVRDKVDL